METIKLKEFEDIVRELGYENRNIGKHMFYSYECDIPINEAMIKYFGKEIDVEFKSLNTFRLKDAGCEWTFHKDWIEQDRFKIYEIDSLFQDIL